MRTARDIAEGIDAPAPLELQMGWLLGRYGVAVMGEKPDFFLMLRATKLTDIYRVFSKLTTAGTKGMSPSEFAFIRDVMREMG